MSTTDPVTGRGAIRYHCPHNCGWTIDVELDHPLDPTIGPLNPLRPVGSIGELRDAIHEAAGERAIANARHVEGLIRTHLAEKHRGPDLEALRQQLRTRRAERHQEPTPTHLHGTSVVCPCGVILGGACVAFAPGYIAPTGPCPDCGVDDGDDFRDEHQPGCTHAEGSL